MRGREFLMKDAYSFHTSEEDLEREYHNIYKTYCSIFDRIGLEYKVVEADTGAIGGGFSQEFMVLAPTGEEEIFYCDKCGYAASRESAGVSKYKIGSPETKESQSVKDVSTPNMKTVEEVCKFLRVKPDQLIKTLIYETEAGCFAALVRGDHELNEAKLKKVIGVEDLHLASEKVVEKATNAPVGFAGPYGLKGVKIVADNVVTLMNDAVSGANKKDHHLINLCYGRDFKADMIGDIRYALREDVCPKCKGGKFLVTRGIEVGHIFKLGTKYSKKMEALYLSEKNKKEPMTMGCYGIGIGRTAAAAVEQSNDENGIIWPVSIAPYVAAIVPINVSVKEQKETAESIYDQLKSKFEVILDDREERIGAKLLSKIEHEVMKTR
jgi:prolyl-tRNA synthetase